jgi:hypothetical protein
MLSTEEFERLQQKKDVRRAIQVSELSDAEADDLVPALEDSIKND